MSSLLALEHQLRLRHQRAQFAIAAGDAGLPDHGGAVGVVLVNRGARVTPTAGNAAASVAPEN